MSLAEEERNNRHACASCKYQRKRCSEGCILAPLFPATRMEEFLAVHKVFGIANVIKVIRNLDSGLREEAVKSFVWVASSWGQDPVYGPLGLYMESEQRRNFLEQRNSFLEQRNSFLEGRLSFLLEQDSYNNVGMGLNYVENNVDFNHVESSLMELNNYPPPLPLVGGEELVGHGIGVVQDGVVQDGVVHGIGFQGVNPNFSPELEAQGSNGRGDHGESSTIHPSLLPQSHERGSAGSYNVAGDGQPVWRIADPSNNLPDQHNQVKVETAEDSTPRKE